jgi:glutamate-ammonia-ligase adenylyltransferase
MDFPPEPMRERLLPLIEEILSGPPLPDVEARLAAAGSPADASTAGHFTRICKELGGFPGNEEKLAVVLASLLESAHPAGALVNFLRYTETVGVSGTFLNTLAEARPLRDVLAAVFGASAYMSDIIIRNPGYLYWLMEKGTWDEEDTASTFEQALRLDTEKFGAVEGRLNAARRFQRRMLLKIGVKDLVGEADIEATTTKLSDLAEAVVRVVLEILWSDLASPPEPRGSRDRVLPLSSGTAPGGLTPPSRGAGAAPPPAGAATEAGSGGFCVLALGKLGGRELNYSSDIDLIYVCRDADDPSIEFYHTIATRLTEALSSVTAEGYLYRTDLRLRPDGASGPLVGTLSAMRIYYESRGRPWEFQAMLKARVIAGDRAVGDEFLKYISGLLLNPSVTGSPMEDITSMRVRIRENISDREKSFNIKLMEGGIRDIEFIVQTLQLVHGAEDPTLRVPGTLEGIRRAHAKKLIKKTEMETMTRAYVFFRLVEHRLQMMHQIQTHSIPDSPGEIELLARRVSKGPLGRFNYESFVSALAAHLNKIRALGESFFAGEGMPETALLSLWPDEDGVAGEILHRYRFADAKRAVSVLQSLAYGSFPRLVDRTTRLAFEKLLSLLLEDCATTGDPDLTLANFARLSEATRSEGGFYRLLTDVPAARLIVRSLTGASSVLTTKLCAHPDLIDLMIEDPEWVVTEPVPERSSLARFAETPNKQNTESLQRDLRDFLDRKLLAAWIVDDRAASFPRTLSATLTATVRESLSIVFERLVADPRGVALLALGSFGAGEPRIESDADVLVVTEGREIEPVTRCVHALNRVFSDGGLLKMDFRLRGEGANAPLVQDVDYYKRYFTTRMAPWEHVAFAKCAYWWGDEKVAGAFFDALLAVTSAPLTAERLTSLLDMRRRLGSLTPKGAERFETKRSLGGRYDIEYLAAIGLAHSGARCPLHASTTERLEILFSAGVISAEDSSMLSRAFEFFHRIDFLLELQGFSHPNTPEKEKRIAGYLDRTFDLLGLPVEGGVGTAVGDCKTRVRHIYERVVDGIGRKAPPA